MKLMGRSSFPLFGQPCDLAFSLQSRRSGELMVDFVRPCPEEDVWWPQGSARQWLSPDGRPGNHSLPATAVTYTR